jgi:signal transduction histidine kinase
MATPGEPPTEKVFGVIQDISIQIEKQHRQTQMLDFLRQQNERLEQFNFIVSHNLRAPMANLMSLAHLMGDTSLSQEQTQLLHFMKDSLENLGNTLNELSDAVMGLQERNLPHTYVQLEELVKKVIKAHQSQIQVKKVQINTHFDYPKLLYIAQYLESILHNLVSNALKFVSNERPPVWEIAFEKHKQYHCLRFRDNGLGLDFKKFGDNVFGLHKTFHRDIPGKGLGLFMTRAQVEALGGQIKLSSEPDQGAEFFIIFDKYHFN